MCEFFSCIAQRDGRIRFTEEDSHETIIDRATLQDTDRHLRHWIRIEVRPEGDGWGPVRVDETDVHGWWSEDRAAWEGKVLALADRVRGYWAAYEAVRGPAWAAYRAVEGPAWAAYEAVEGPAMAAYAAVKEPAWAAYAAVERPAWAAYEAVEGPAWAAYEAVQRPARAAYEAVEGPAMAAYEAVERPAMAAYVAVQEPAWAAYRDALARMPGYVPTEAK